MTLQAQTPLISIVLPTWNCAELLREAIVSVQKQTWENWELIIINNFSTDHTKDVIASFADSRIKVIDFNNKGVIAAARNVGIQASAGEYVSFLDSDDFWYPTKLQRCFEVLQEAGADLVCHGERHFKDEPDGTRVEWDVFYGTGQEISASSMLYRGNFLSTSAVLAKGDLVRRLKGFDTTTSINTAEDYDLWLRIMESGAKVTLLAEILGAYRIHGSSASASLLRHVTAVREVVVNHHRNFAAQSTFGFLYRMGRIALSSSRGLWRAGDHKAAWTFMRSTLAKMFYPRNNVS